MGFLKVSQTQMHSMGGGLGGKIPLICLHLCQKNFIRIVVMSSRSRRPKWLESLLTEKCMVGELSQVICFAGVESWRRSQGGNVTEAGIAHLTSLDWRWRLELALFWRVLARWCQPKLCDSIPTFVVESRSFYHTCSAIWHKWEMRLASYRPVQDPMSSAETPVTRHPLHA